MDSKKAQGPELPRPMPIPEILASRPRSRPNMPDFVQVGLNTYSNTMCNRAVVMAYIIF